MSWIPVEDRLPERGYWLVTCEGLANAREAYYDRGVWWDDEDKENGLPHRIIAWQPLPAPYVKPRRFVVVRHAYEPDGYLIGDTKDVESVVVAKFIPTREAAETIANVYEEAYR